MLLLNLIWAAALALVALSLTGMALLVGGRLLSRRRARLAAGVRQQLLSCIVSGRAPALALDEAVDAAARHHFLASLILQVCTIVRGQARDVFLTHLAKCGAVGLLGRTLRHGSRMERVRAAEALGAFAEHGAAAHLRAGWRDRDARVRFAAYLASIEIGDGPTFDQALTIAIAASGKKHVAATKLLRGLSSNRPLEAVDWMRRVDLAPSLRCALVEGLGAAAPSADIVSVLIDEARHLDLEVRSNAITALACCKATSGHPTILAALADPAWPVRVRAIAAVSKLRLHPARPALERMLDDGDWWVRYRASEALGALNCSSKGAAA